MNQAITLPDSATPVELPAETRRKITDIFTREEIRMLTERSDLAGFVGIGFTWGVIFLTLAMLAWAAQQSLPVAVLLFVPGVIILGGRHLALAILMHEASHGTLFRTKWLNDTFADWVCAKPIWNDVQKYKVHHFAHHSKTGQQGDTDLSLVAGLPCTRASLWRKFARDLSGYTGLKFLLGRTLMDAGVIQWTVSNDIQKLPQEGRRWHDYLRDLVSNGWRTALVHAVLFGMAWASGHAWLYGVFVLTYITPFPLILRIRSMAEHACTEQSTDMFRNTRSTRAGLLARMTVAPHRVNYHIEHHVMASVPFRKLPLMHRMLRERGAVPPAPGYLDVLRIVSTPSTATATTR
ncbi:MAG: fatty acid desaturase family protein [Moraxellaceae bacterium]|nr:fatty acid desaturase family protein [Moraxellaceae bacterium]